MEGNGDRPWEVHSRSSWFTTRARRPLVRFHLWKELSLWLSGVDDCWETYPSALMDTILCLTTICRLASAVVGQWSNTCASNVWAKNSNRTTVRTFSNFNLLHGRCMLLPFPSALTSLCAPVAVSWAIQHFRGLMYSCACSSFRACGLIVSDLKYTPQSVQEHLLACLQKGHCNHYVYEYI